MEQIELKMEEGDAGHFYISERGERFGEMEISIADGQLTVYHTEVIPKAEGRGFAKKLLDAMVDHARKNALTVVPLCPYVQLQFKRHPEDYADVWKHN